MGPHDTIYAHQYLLQLETLLPTDSRKVLGMAGMDDITNQQRFDLVNEMYTKLEGAALHWCINIHSESDIPVEDFVSNTILAGTTSPLSHTCYSKTANIQDEITCNDRMLLLPQVWPHGQRMP